MKASVLLTIAGLLIVSCACPSSASSHWPQFRGPNGQGIAETGKPPIYFGPATNLLWKTALPEGSSSPCIWEDAIFLTGSQRAEKRLETICVNRKNGAVRWRRNLVTEKMEPCHEINNPAAPTPATDGTNVVVYFGSFGLLAYDFNGLELWRKSLPLPKVRFGHGTGTSPILVNGRVILSMQLETDSYLAAYDARDAHEIWRASQPLYNESWSTPVFWNESDGPAVGLITAGRFAAYDARDGRERWWVDGVANQVCATPAIANDIIFLTSAGVMGERGNIFDPPTFEDVVKKHDRNKDGLIELAELPSDLMFAKRGASDGAGDMTLAFGLRFGGADDQTKYNAESWEKARQEILEFKQSAMNKTSAMAVKSGGRGDVTATRMIWQESKGVPEVPSPLVYEKRVFMIKNGGMLTCRDAASGRALFEERIGAAGGYYASPVAAAGRVYAASDAGVVVVLRAADKLDVLARNELGERIMATPAIADDQLYIRTASHLFAFGTK